MSKTDLWTERAAKNLIRAVYWLSMGLGLYRNAKIKLIRGLRRF